MPTRTLVISRGPSLVILNGRWMRPWERVDERSTVTFSGHYADTGEEGSVTVAVDGLRHLYKKNGSQIRVDSILMALDGAEVDERQLNFYYHTKKHAAHILI